MMARWAAILFLCGVLWIAFCACAPKATDQIAKIGKEPERPAPAILTVTPWTRWKVKQANDGIQGVLMNCRGRKHGCHGFASMHREDQRAIASEGGIAAHEKGTAHEWTAEEAREMGRRGGVESQRRRRERLEKIQPIVV